MESKKKVTKVIKAKKQEDIQVLKTEEPVVEPIQQEITVQETEVLDIQEKVTKETKALSLSQLNKKLLKTLKKGKKELTQQEVDQLNTLYKQEFLGCKVTLSHLLYSDLSEKCKKQTILLEDSRLPHGFVQIKKKFPTLKQIIMQISSQYPEELLKENNHVMSLNYTNINDKVDHLTVNWQNSHSN